MRDLVEGLAVLTAVALVFGPVIGYVLFSRYLARKEQAALREFGLTKEGELR
ncbi:MAG: hypothetical protein KA362_09115 [Chloroflexi bacterium]|nr:hypothetical protein [Chloroflexota bacterium]MBK7180522.1 hypothetical protein [Chloroflexota bacterium]MBK8934606.1 hypothetical protein [Chloroflexota bacterium]MBP6804258.1 hypothetical protein [Chloroflexota bacterium]MBP7590792.1 hypothetical protein [Chloroflexota bacterium]